MTLCWNDIALRVQRLVTAKAPEARAREYSELWDRLAGTIEHWTGSPRFLGRVRDDEDHRREIVVRSWAGLRVRDYARLRAAPAEAHRLRAFLYRVIKNIGTDYLRTLPELIRSRGTETDHGEHWYQLVTLEAMHETGDEDAIELRAIVVRMLRVLDEPKRTALELWSAGCDNELIAAALHLPNDAAADRMVNAAKELLRRRFRPAFPSRNLR